MAAACAASLRPHRSLIPLRKSDLHSCSIWNKRMLSLRGQVGEDGQARFDGPIDGQASAALQGRQMATNSKAIYRDSPSDGLSHQAPVFQGSAALLSAIREITPKIAERAGEIEEKRRFPDDLYQDVAATGLFQMMVPRKYGGAEYSLPEAVPIIEELGRADGSTAWSMMLGSEIHIAWTRFPDEILREVYKSPRAAMTRGALTPKGKVTKVEGGYVLNGQWPLASGSYPTDWFLVGGMISDEAGRPLLSPDGLIDIMLSAVPAADVEVLDTWYSMGLRSTESHDIKLDNYFVSSKNTAFCSTFDKGAGPIGRIPIYSALGTFHLGVLLGIARGMLDELTESAKTKRPMLTPKVMLSQSPLFQKRLAVSRLDWRRPALSF